MVTLFCPDTSELKLGPGTSASDPDVVTFRNHFAEIDNDDPLLADKLRWARHPGSPPIVVLDDEAPAVAGAVTCPQCAAAGIVKAFATDRRLGAHLMSHRTRNEVAK